MHISDRDRAEQWDIVGRAIKRLDAENRRAAIVLVLVLWHRRSVTSVARRLRVPVRDIREELRRARARFAELIDHEAAKLDARDAEPPRPAGESKPLAANGARPPKDKP
jgi:DNA-directed RNA polymerase specialized sigma24 family protein